MSLKMKVRLCFLFLFLFDGLSVLYLINNPEFYLSQFESASLLCKSLTLGVVSSIFALPFVLLLDLIASE